MRVAGIMSGTSLDGIDVAVVDLKGAGWKTAVSVAGFVSKPYPKRVREMLLSISNTDTHTACIARAGFLLAELYAEAFAEACRKLQIPAESVELIGCHGQTIFHEGVPVKFCGRRIASTLQIGDSSVLAERTRIPVVGDFRPRDMAVGGGGAPLVPFFDYLLLRDRNLGRVAVNIGGIANLTAIPADAAPDEVIAFDTGPGNMVIDSLVKLYTKGRHEFDRGGRLAARGKLHDNLLRSLMNEPYLRARPPKTGGREQYGSEFIDRLLSWNASEVDTIATATAYSAATIACGIRRFVAPRMRVDELVAGGGGTHNRQIMGYLAAFLPGVRIRTMEEFGISSDAKEAVAFAVLAHETWRRRASNVPSATGADRRVVLGKVSY